MRIQIFREYEKQIVNKWENPILSQVCLIPKLQMFSAHTKVCKKTGILHFPDGPVGLCPKLFSQKYP